MNFKELITEATKSQYFYIVIVLVAIILYLFVKRINHRKKLNKRIDDAQVKINDLKSHPFAVDIAKIDAVARINSDLKNTASKCKVDFETIQTNLKSAVSLLQDASEDLQTSNFKGCIANLEKLEPLLNETKSITNKLDDVLAAILNQSAMQRKHINELKGKFHDIKQIVNDSPNQFTYCWESLDGITNNISHMFSDFESIMDASRYDDAAEKAQEIDESINNLEVLVNRLPAVINTARVTIPNAVNSLNSSYLVGLSQQAFLDHLSIPETIDSIADTVSGCLDKIKVCQLDGVDGKLKDVQGIIDSLSTALEDEKGAFRNLVKVKGQVESSLQNCNEVLTNISENQSDCFVRYSLNALKEDYEKSIADYNESYSSFVSLSDTFYSNTIPASTLLISFNALDTETNMLLKRIQTITSTLTSTKTEESRVRELVNRFVVVLNESKASIRLSRLPSISKKYNDDIEKAENYIKDLNSELANENIDIELLTKTVNEAQKVIISLYKNVNSLIDTTKDIENYIILCNKYRPYYPEVDSALYSAELAYRNGEYTKACRLTASVLSKIDSQLAKELNENINQKLLLQKEN